MNVAELKKRILRGFAYPELFYMPVPKTIEKTDVYFAGVYLQAFYFNRSEEKYTERFNFCSGMVAIQSVSDDRKYRTTALTSQYQKLKSPKILSPGEYKIKILYMTGGYYDDVWISLTITPSGKAYSSNPDLRFELTPRKVKENTVVDLRIYITIRYAILKLHFYMDRDIEIPYETSDPGYITSVTKGMYEGKNFTPTEPSVTTSLNFDVKLTGGYLCDISWDGVQIASRILTTCNNNSGGVYYREKMQFYPSVSAMMPSGLGSGITVVGATAAILPKVLPFKCSITVNAVGVIIPGGYYGSTNFGWQEKYEAHTAIDITTAYCKIGDSVLASDYIESGCGGMINVYSGEVVNEYSTGGATGGYAVNLKANTSTAWSAELSPPGMYFTDKPYRSNYPVDSDLFWTYCVQNKWNPFVNGIDINTLANFMYNLDTYVCDNPQDLNFYKTHGSIAAVRNSAHWNVSPLTTGADPRPAIGAFISDHDNQNTLSMYKGWLDDSYHIYKNVYATAMSEAVWGNLELLCEMFDKTNTLNQTAATSLYCSGNIIGDPIFNGYMDITDYSPLRLRPYCSKDRDLWVSDSSVEIIS